MSLNVSIIIPTLNRGEALVRALESLLPQIRQRDELIVVDQSPAGAYNAATQNRLMNWERKNLFRWVRLRQRPSVASARNTGLRSALRETVVFVDDEIIVPPRFLDSHRRNYQDSRIAAVSGPALDARHPTLLQEEVRKRGIFITAVPTHWGTGFTQT